MAIVIHRTIRSRRRSLALEITDEGRLVVRAPRSLSQSQILRFVDEKSVWIRKKIGQVTCRAQTALPALTPDEEQRLRSIARDAFIERACLYGQRMGVKFKEIRLSSAKTRWGSCSPKGNLNFNWRLINAPADVLDYVVVHELSHLIEKNHSARFWVKVGEFCPHYRSAQRWLKENRV